MKLSTRICFIAAISVFMIGSDFDTGAPVIFCLVNDAEAVIGRPLTPLSVAGVRRRTRRRTAVVTAAVVATPVVVAPAPVLAAPPPLPPTVIYVPAPAPVVNITPAQLAADQAACQEYAMASSGYDPANPEAFAAAQQTQAISAGAAAYTGSYNECMASLGYQ
jgi:hypothetical protein